MFARIFAAKRTPIRAGEIVYTDVLFAGSQERRARKLLRLALMIESITSAAWTVNSFLELGVNATTVVFLLFSVIPVAMLLLERRIALRSIGHAFYWLGFVFIWFIQIELEGIPRAHVVTTNLWFVPLVVATFLVLHREKPIVLATYSALALVSFIICEFALFTSVGAYQYRDDDGGLEAGITVISVFVTLVLLTQAWAREVHDAEKNLALANDRLEELLENMLPRSISERLRREGKTFADALAECSVLFVDIVGFTKLSAGMPAEDLVRLLDEIFSKFDDLTVKAGVEKIKTIGDAYMVASGLLETRADHAQALIRLAMQMRDIIGEYNLHIRCGINSGKVVAGVIGKKRFIYDLWGDTVNVAARMESHGVVDEIQVTQTTADLIEAEFELAPRGEITIKGKGDMPVFLVVGEHAR